MPIWRTDLTKSERFGQHHQIVRNRLKWFNIVFRKYVLSMRPPKTDGIENVQNFKLNCVFIWSYVLYSAISGIFQPL